MASRRLSLPFRRSAAPQGAGAAKGTGSTRTGTGSGSTRTGGGTGSTRTSKGTGKDKAQAKATKAAKRAARRQRITQVRTAFTMTRKADNRLVPLMAIAFFVPFVLLLSLGLLLDLALPLGFLGFMLGLLAMTLVFGRRVQRTTFSQVEGQLGAAAAVLSNMRGNWRVTPAVGFTREQDLLHRVVGRPGVVLVGEGSTSRTRGLLVAEKKRLARFVGETPVYDVVVGDGDGQVPLRALEKHFTKLPRNIEPKDVNVLDRKLKAMAPAVPLPKGPVPRGGRMPRGR